MTTIPEDSLPTCVNTHGVNIFHVTDCDTVIICISDNFIFYFFPTCHWPLNQDLVGHSECLPKNILSFSDRLVQPSPFSLSVLILFQREAFEVSIPGPLLPYLITHNQLPFPQQTYLQHGQTHNSLNLFITKHVGSLSSSSPLPTLQSHSVHVPSLSWSV